MAALFIASSLSTVPSPPAGLTDKHEHFFSYAVLAALTLRALAKGEWRRITFATVIGAVAISTAYGVSDEFHQRFVPGRHYDVLDMAANAIGSIVAGGLLWAWSIIRRPSDTRRAR